MAQGDVVSGFVALVSGGVGLISAATGQEWVIHNIYRTESIRLEFSDGSVTIAFLTQPGPGLMSNFQFHVTKTRWIQIREWSGAARTFAFDGIQTK